VSPTVCACGRSRRTTSPRRTSSCTSAASVSTPSLLARTPGQFRLLHCIWDPCTVPHCWLAMCMPLYYCYRALRAGHGGVQGPARRLNCGALRMPALGCDTCTDGYLRVYVAIVVPKRTVGHPRFHLAIIVLNRTDGHLHFYIAACLLQCTDGCLLGASLYKCRCVDKSRESLKEIERL
jgi:hypothetical protein